MAKKKKKKKQEEKELELITPLVTRTKEQGEIDLKLLRIDGTPLVVREQEIRFNMNDQNKELYGIAKDMLLSETGLFKKFNLKSLQQRVVTLVITIPKTDEEAENLMDIKNFSFLHDSVPIRKAEFNRDHFYNQNITGLFEKNTMIIADSLESNVTGYKGVPNDKDATFTPFRPTVLAGSRTKKGLVESTFGVLKIAYDTAISIYSSNVIKEFFAKDGEIPQNYFSHSVKMKIRDAISLSDKVVFEMPQTLQESVEVPTDTETLTEALASASITTELLDISSTEEQDALQLFSEDQKSSEASAPAKKDISSLGEQDALQLFLGNQKEAAAIAPTKKDLSSLGGQDVSKIERTRTADRGGVTERLNIAAGFVIKQLQSEGIDIDIESALKYVSWTKENSFSVFLTPEQVGDLTCTCIYNYMEHNHLLHGPGKNNGFKSKSGARMASVHKLALARMIYIEKVKSHDFARGKKGGCTKGKCPFSEPVHPIELKKIKEEMKNFSKPIIKPTEKVIKAREKAREKAGEKAIKARGQKSSMLSSTSKGVNLNK